jgi:hypothetical protein
MKGEDDRDTAIIRRKNRGKVKLKVLSIFSLIALVLGAIFVFLPAPTLADSPTYYSTSNDGTLTSYSDNYSIAHDNHILTSYDNCSAESTTSSVFAGQKFDSSIYTIYRAVFVFDTTAIPSYADISSWSVQLYGIGSTTLTTDNMVLVQGGDVHNPLQYSDFDVLLPKTTAISDPLLSWSVGAYNTFSGTDLDIINVGGYTVIGLRFSDDIDSTVPSPGSNYVQIASSESAHPPKLIVNYNTALLGPADSIGLSGVSVISKYRITGDELIAFQTTVKYNTSPSTSDPGDYYLISLYDTDNTTLLAQTPLARWGYSPQSIYLSPANVLTWGKHYLLTISSTSLILSPQSYSYVLQNADWKGSSLSDLKTWTYETANWMGLSEQKDYRYYYDKNDYTKISLEGSQIFVTGVPYITTALSSIFDSPGIDSGDIPNTDSLYSQSLYAHWGTYWTSTFDAVGSTVNLSGTWIFGIGIAFLCIVAYALVSSKWHSSSLALITTIPIIGIGVFFGSPPLIAVVAGALACGFWLVIQVVLYKM